ncbi:hypothetical protein HK100_000278 [Physocladia obscura]|uniref:CENP-V/GFA domain-containing protein n=1 Tax=Physocladia obscura TaxID=109957 RepID=A0AAD5XBX4_9FUNG|nr:hypothetical protein HK100_000278 [Physocladia obscura]
MHTSTFLSCHCQQHVLAYNPKDTAHSGHPATKGEICDCSYCAKRKIVWGYALAGELSIVRGVLHAPVDGKISMALTEYRFATKRTPHYFCSTCGTHLLGTAYDVTKTIAISLLAVRNLPADSQFFRTNELSQKAPIVIRRASLLSPQYTQPLINSIPFAEHLVDVENLDDFDPPRKVLVGACHCQVVKFAVLSRDIEVPVIIEDVYNINGEVMTQKFAKNSGARNGCLWIFPGIHNVLFSPHFPIPSFIPPSSVALPWQEIQTAENLSTLANVTTTYKFNQQEIAHVFCSTCGCTVFELGGENVGGMPFGLNVALINDFSVYLENYAAEVSGTEKRLGGLRIDRDAINEEPRFLLKL